MPVKSIALSAAAAALVAGLLAWMLLQVAEHPGVPREVAALPQWFTGIRPAAQQPSSAAAPAHPAKGSEAAAAAPFVQVDGGTIEILFTEYEMKPNRIRAGPGALGFVLRNEGRFAHNFHIEGPGVDTTAEKFSPGRTVRLELSLGVGEYKISCPLSNHDQRGMHGLLLIAAKGG